MIETLELRTMLSTAVSLSGDAGSNSFDIRRVGDNVDFYQNEPITATPTVTVPYASLGPVTITGGGSSTITLDYSGGDLLPNSLAFTGESPAIAPNQLIVKGATSAGYTLGSGTLAINATGISDSITFTSLPDFNFLGGGGGISSIEITSGSFNFNNNLGGSGTAVNMTVDSGASAYFSSTQNLNSLTINSGGFVQMVPTGENNSDGDLLAGGQVLDTNTLVVSGILDLANNDLIVNDPTTDAMNLLQQQVANGVNDAANTQATIVSSTAAADTTAGAGFYHMTIGVAPESQIDLETLDGQTIPSSALVARYAQMGDALLQGYVDSSDISLVANGYNNSLTGWANGDFYYQGV